MGVLRNERGVIVDWFAKTILVLALFGVVLFDSGSLAINYFGLANTADDIAVALSTDVTGGAADTQQQVEEEAARLAQEAGARLVKAELDPEGQIYIKLRRRASTLVLGRISATEDWTKATANARASTN